MQRLRIALLIIFCSVAYCSAGTKYTTKYDAIDLDAVIRNDRLLGNYVDCVMDRKRCTNDGAELKRNLPDALKNDCLNCNDIQKLGSKKILKHLITNKRDWFLELETKYDPTHVFRQRHNDDLKNEGVSF